MVPTIRQLRPDELEWANQRYAEIEFLLSSPADFVVVAEMDGPRVGLGRLVPIAPGTAELGGIYVLPDFRGRAVASAIVAFLLQHSPYADLYCIPFSYLSHFYAAFGFTAMADDRAAPAPIKKKLEWCGHHHPTPVSLLYRSAR